MFSSILSCLRTCSVYRFGSKAHVDRLEEVTKEIEISDTYQLKDTELIYGAKHAWRNAARCVGRIQWSKLQVLAACTNRSNMESQQDQLCTSTCICGFI